MKLFRRKKQSEKKQDTLTPAQIKLVRAVYEDRGCAYCGNLRSAVNWWCGSKEAIAMRHTSIPGIIHCPFWAPDKALIRAELKDLENKAKENDKK